MNRSDAPGGLEPEEGPARPDSPAEREAFEEMVKGSLPAVRSMAASWRTGMTALVTLVTTGVILTGRNATTTIAVPWRIAVTVAIGGGLALAIWGLWLTLGAEAGFRARGVTLDEIHASHASVETYQVDQAAAAGRRFNWARTSVALALVLLVTGTLLTWWAPAVPATPSAYLEVRLADETICGTLEFADGRTLRLVVADTHESVLIALNSVTRMAIVTDCS